mmetsp:Transcript_1485/g.3389  ORF Transcript_1485/g.3389 Transcript_1485/m.3389 type:complete len:359 (-) Transcript_1485:968-2044(-)
MISIFCGDANISIGIFADTYHRRRTCSYVLRRSVETLRSHRSLISSFMCSCWLWSFAFSSLETRNCTIRSSLSFAPASSLASRSARVCMADCVKALFRSSNARNCWRKLCRSFVCSARSCNRHCSAVDTLRCASASAAKRSAAALFALSFSACAVAACSAFCFSNTPRRTASCCSLAALRARASSLCCRSASTSASLAWIWAYKRCVVVCRRFWASTKVAARDSSASRAFCARSCSSKSCFCSWDTSSRAFSSRRRLSLVWRRRSSTSRRSCLACASLSLSMLACNWATLSSSSATRFLRPTACSSHSLRCDCSSCCDARACARSRVFACISASRCASSSRMLPRSSFASVSIPALRL